MQIGKKNEKEKNWKRFGQHVCPHSTADGLWAISIALLLDIISHIFKVRGSGLGDVSHMESFATWLMGWRRPIAPLNISRLYFHPPSYFPSLLDTSGHTHPPKKVKQNLIDLWEVMFSQARQTDLITYCFPHFKYLQPSCPLIKLGEKKNAVLQVLIIVLSLLRSTKSLFCRVWLE